MKTKHPPVPIIILLVLALLTGGYFGIKALTADKENGLFASGTIEADQVTIAPEIGGKVTEVTVMEGMRVKTGDVLFRVDDSLLLAQRDVAAANLAQAQNARQLAEAGLAVAMIQSGDLRTSDWWLEGPDGYALPGWYFSQNENVRAHQLEVEKSKAALTAARAALDALLVDPAHSDFVAAEQRLSAAKAGMLVVKDMYDRANIALNGADLRSAARELYDAARDELTDAQKAYDDLMFGDGPQAIIDARAALAAAEERYQSARGQLLAAESGINTVNLAGGESALRNAELTAEQTRLAVNQAETSLALIDTQLAKLTVTAPMNGVILTSTVTVGEVVAAGSSTMLLGDLSNLSIVVYVPETIYGQLNLGQSARITVDSFPAETFTAAVTGIANQAEFTPRNVQSVEGRGATVYAITLRINNPEGKLKPGMPADVTFEQGFE
ncbi:MAG: efflux RND transporter periplasmic adaptor subunit [Anaerolineaceae bacterium]|nr:efflux RND transporter periplasmic adaptor subunit [Anaerolineaceae bacterium]